MKKNIFIFILKTRGLSPTFIIIIIIYNLINLLKIINQAKFFMIQMNFYEKNPYHSDHL